MYNKIHWEEKKDHPFSHHLFLFSLLPKSQILTMAPNGNAVRGALAPGHFLFTSESVGEGHPGMNLG
jgi:hypothetical protein